MNDERQIGPDGHMRSASLLTAPAGDLEISSVPTGLTDNPIRLSLVIPTYNESRNIRELISRLTHLLETTLQGAYELILVDDDSPDRTWEIGQALMKEYPNLHVMRRVGERGLSTAVIRGWHAARGDVLAVIDADLQHPPKRGVARAEEHPP